MSSRGGKLDSKKKKEEVADKVREIKLRQQNWLKQREEHIQDGPKASSQTTRGSRQSSTGNSSKNKGTTKSTLSRTQSADVNSIPRQNIQKTSDNSIVSRTEVNPRGKFQNWLQARGSKHDIESETINNRGNSAPAVYDISQPNADYLFLDEEQMSDEDTSEGLKARLMKPKDFDALADKIVSRAWRDMDSRDSKQRSEASERIVSDDEPIAGDTNMSNHLCPCCGGVMIGSHHTPMLLIPCGHTVCRACCQGRELCPDCYCSIGSTTCNIMLQQIIQEYQGRQPSHKPTLSRTYRKDDHYSPQDYQEHRNATSSVDRQHYREQFQNLKTRLEILKSEKSSAKHECERLSEAVQQEAHQVRNIAKQEDNICSQINSLEEKLSVLRQHKAEYEHRCEELKTEREDAQKRLAMLRNTMEALGNEMEKFKLLSEA